MFRRLRLALVATTLSLASIGFNAAPVAASGVQGSCHDDFTWGGALAQFVYGHTVPNTTALDEMHGWITTRYLWPCEGLGHSFGWSYAGAANMQGPNGLYQLGYISDAGDAGEQPYFTYTMDDGSGDSVAITSVRPVIGVRYHYRISKTAGGNILYTILDQDDNVIWTRNTLHGFDNSWKIAWWGWEIANMYSAAGICGNCTNADLVGLYSTTSTASVLTKANILPFPDEPDGDPNDHTHMNVSGTFDEILNVRTDQLNQPSG